MCCRVDCNFDINAEIANNFDYRNESRIDKWPSYPSTELLVSTIQVVSQYLAIQ